MKTVLTRRKMLTWLLGAATTAVAAFQVPVRLVGRLLGAATARRIEIPTRPFDRRDLRGPHDLAG